MVARRQATRQGLPQWVAQLPLDNGPDDAEARGEELQIRICRFLPKLLEVLLSLDVFLGFFCVLCLFSSSNLTFS